MGIKLNLHQENFDLYFANQVQFLTEHQKAKLPKTILMKLYRGGAEFNPRNTNQLSTLERFLVLNKALGKRIHFIVEDDKGVSLDDYANFRDDLKRLPNDVSAIDEFDGAFFLSNKDLSDGFDYLNDLATNPMYAYHKRLKNMPKSKIKFFKDKMAYIVRMFYNYEISKKKMVMQCGLNMPELLVLMYLYTVNGYTKTSQLHKKELRYCFQSSTTRLKEAFGTLQTKGFVNKRGNTKSSELSISQYGKEHLNDIIHTYFSKF